MLMPGSGLGAAFVGADGLSLDGDTLAGMEAGHMPAPLHLLGLTGKPFPCGCGRDWGCVEAYTTISGLPHLLAEKLQKYPGHELAKSAAPIKEKVLSLRSRAQKGDALALEIFDFQARVMGLHVANLAMALDPGIVVIGGGLMDHEATTPEFRERYLGVIRDTAAPYSGRRSATPSKLFPMSWANCRRPSARRSWRFIKAALEAQPWPAPARRGGAGIQTGHCIRVAQILFNSRRFV